MTYFVKGTYSESTYRKVGNSADFLKIAIIQTSPDGSSFRDETHIGVAEYCDSFYSIYAEHTTLTHGEKDRESHDILRYVLSTTYDPYDGSLYPHPESHLYRRFTKTADDLVTFAAITLPGFGAKEEMRVEIIFGHSGRALTMKETPIARPAEFTSEFYHLTQGPDIYKIG